MMTLVTILVIGLASIQVFHLVLFLVSPRETFPERYSVHRPVTQTDPFLVIHLDYYRVTPMAHKSCCKEHSSGMRPNQSSLILPANHIHSGNRYCLPRCM